jgi:hypothetical protein
VSRFILASLPGPSAPAAAEGSGASVSSGRNQEKRFGRALAQLPPGGKLSLCFESGGGETLAARGQGKVEIEPAPDGGYDLTFEPDGTFWARVDRGAAQAELAATGNAKVTVHCKSHREAVEALSAGDVAPGLHRMRANLSRVEGELGLEAAAERGLSLGPLHTTGMGLEGAATLKVRLDLTAGTLALERRFVGTTPSSEGGRKSATLRQRVKLSSQDLADLKSGKLSLRRAAGRLLSSEPAGEIELQQEGHLGHQAYQGRKVIPFQGPQPDLAALRGLIDSSEGGWTWEARSRHDLGAQATVEVPLVTTQGSFTDFYTALSHRVGQSARDASFLAFRRAMAR